jgi:ketosteroid isomerase-like protein
MKSCFITGLVVASLTGVGGCAPADNGGDAPMTDPDRAAMEGQLIQIEHDWTGAYESGDLSALHRIFAEDFIYTVNDGTLYDKAGFIALAEEYPIDADSVRVEDYEIRWYGSTPVVTGVGVTFWTDEDGVIQRDASRFTNVFVERDGQWQVVVGHSSPTQ